MSDVVSTGTVVPNRGPGLVPGAMYKFRGLSLALAKTLERRLADPDRPVRALTSPWLKPGVSTEGIR